MRAGILACWNHPFEVARIEAQARGDQNQKDLNMVQIFRMIIREQVPLAVRCCNWIASDIVGHGFYKGVVVEGCVNEPAEWTDACMHTLKLFFATAGPQGALQGPVPQGATGHLAGDCHCPVLPKHLNAEGWR